MNRRAFIQDASIVMSGTLLTKPIGTLAFCTTEDLVIGHGDYKYKVNKEWGALDPNRYPVNDCHEMVMDKKERIILLTNEPRNNILIYDKSGRLLENWTLNLSGAHGLSIHEENGSEFLYITDVMRDEVYKTTLTGHVLLTIKHPKFINQYQECDKFKPTETCVGPSGDIYIADGYGSQYVLQYSSKGEFIRKFGGDSAIQEDKFKQVHGITLDMRNPKNPTLLCTARMKNCFKRFTLEGKYIESIYIPGAYLSRAVIKGEMLYSGVCFSALKNHYLTLNSGFVTILNKNNIVVSNPGGTAPIYIDGQLQPIVQDQAIFKHCHDVCVDNDDNLYVPQWNAGKVYPYKLTRV
jgi:peptidylamidoglycolate lyase